MAVKDVMSSELNLKIKPLDGSNYVSWSRKITQVLKQQGLWQLVQGTHTEADGVVMAYCVC